MGKFHLEEFSGIIVHKLNNILTPLLMLKSLYKEDIKLTEHISKISEKIEDLKESLTEFALKRSAKEKLFSANEILKRVLTLSLPVDCKIKGNPERFEWALKILKDYVILEKINVKKTKGEIQLHLPLNQNVEINQMDLNGERIDYNYIDILLSYKILTRYGWKFQIENYNQIKISYSV